jgi:hypothetical protein
VGAVARFFITSRPLPSLLSAGAFSLYGLKHKSTECTPPYPAPVHPAHNYCMYGYAALLCATTRTGTLVGTPPVRTPPRPHAGVWCVIVVIVHTPRALALRLPRLKKAPPKQPRKKYNRITCFKSCCRWFRSVSASFFFARVKTVTK